MNANQAVLLISLYKQLIEDDKFGGTLEADLVYLQNSGYIERDPAQQLVHSISECECIDGQECSACDESKPSIYEIEGILTPKGEAWVKAVLSLEVEKKQIFIVNLPVDHNA